MSKSKVYFTKDITPEAHWQTIKEHGFSDIAPCDIMDEEGEIALKVEGGKHLKENYVGAHIKNIIGHNISVKQIQMQEANSDENT